jgi:hypothetical protein
MRVYDAEEAQRSAKILREIADRVDRGEIKYISLLGLHTVEAAPRYGYVFVSLNAPLETISTAEYLLMLGVARDHYLDAEQQLRERGAAVTADLDRDDEDHEFGR